MPPTAVLPAHIPFVEAHPNRFKRLMTQRPWQLIVIHDMEAPETDKTAENVANWFHTASTPQTSAHYCIDNNSIVQCVQLRDVAYAAPNANRNGIHIELAGRASQSRSDWLDEYSTAMLRLAAALIAKVIIPKTGIPAEYLDFEDLRRGRVGTPVRGITTHRDVTKAYNTVGGHTDPGPNFPMSDFIQMVKSAM